jgi:hypothetical protein
MTAAEFELLTAAQAEAILVERYRRLIEAGYPPESALLTASVVQIDLALAERLLSEAKPDFSLCTIF